VLSFEGKEGPNIKTGGRGGGTEEKYPVTAIALKGKEVYTVRDRRGEEKGFFLKRGVGPSFACIKI